MAFSVSLSGSVKPHPTADPTISRFHTNLHLQILLQRLYKTEGLQIDLGKGVQFNLEIYVVGVYEMFLIGH
jgi:hypothetical protein